MPVTITHGSPEPFVGGSPPGQPTGVVAVAGDGFAVVSWVIPPTNNSAILDNTVAVVGNPRIPPTILNGADTAMAVVLGLMDGASYTFTVTARNQIGPSLPSAPSNAVTPLGVPKAPPTAVSVVAGDHSGLVSFTRVPAGSNGGSPIDAYRVTPYIGGVAQPGLATSAPPPPPMTVSGLALGTAYTVTVAAHNAVGFGPESLQSNTFTPTGAPPTVPGQVTGVTVTPGDSQLSASWAVPGNGGSAILDYTVGWTAVVNLALQHPVTVSSTSTDPGGPFVAANAVDGNGATRWASASGVDPQWIYVDLGAPTAFSEVVLIWEVAYASSYQIQTSNDAVTWSTIYSTTTGTGGTNDLTGLAGNGRYVRMFGTVRGTAFGYSLWELQVLP